MKFKLLLSLILLIILHQSCRKGISDGDSIAPPAPTAADSNFLWKIYGMEINDLVVDTIQTFTYYYDNLKRVTSIVNSSKNIFKAKQQTYKYSYKKTDSLPYKSTLFQLSADNPELTQLSYDTITSYHTYDNNARNLKDSVIHSHKDNLDGYYSTYCIKNYSYGGNKIYGLTSFFPINVPNPNFVEPDRRDTAWIDENGNIISNQSYQFNSIENKWDLSIISNFTYDEEQSPFSKLSNFKTFGVFPNGETFLMQLPQKNNRVSQHEQHNGNHYEYNYLNTYNSNVDVNGISIYEQPPNPNVYGKMSLVYKPL